MKRIIGILALLCACTQSVDVRAEEFTKEEVCAVWAGNATLGGSQALRGKARKIGRASCRERVLRLV